VSGRWWQERGSTSVLFLSIWSVALITLAFAVDVGRVYVVREQLRTAEEAAALAGVLQAQYMVEARFHREENRPRLECEESDEEGEPPDCHLKDNWVRIAPAVIRGPEAQVWPEAQRAWADQCGGYDIRCKPRYSSSDCWIEPRQSMAAVRSAALDAFALNDRWGDQARLAGPVAVDLEGVNTSKPRHLKVGVKATLEMETLLLNVLGVDALTVATQGGPTTAELVRRDETGLKVWIDGALVPSPCLLR